MNMQELVVAVQNGLKFSPMDETDCESFAGAPEDALIAYSDIAIYILKGNNLSVITEDFETRYTLKLQLLQQRSNCNV
jgi:hypothetical protein